MTDYAYESDLQRACVDTANKIGCWAMPNIVVRTRRGPSGLGTGSPDVVVAIPMGVDAVIVFFELKQPKTGRVSDAQKRWHERAKRTRVRVHTIRSVNEMVAVITAIRFGRAA